MGLTAYPQGQIDRIIKFAEQGLSRAEVAEVMGWTPGQVKHRWDVVLEQRPDLRKRKEGVRERVLQSALYKSGEKFHRRDMMAELGCEYGTLNSSLTEMKRRGELEGLGRGMYKPRTPERKLVEREFTPPTQSEYSDLMNRPFSPNPYPLHLPSIESLSLQERDHLKSLHTTSRIRLVAVRERANR